MTGKKANRPFAFLSMNTSRGQERASDKHPLSDAEEEGVRMPKGSRLALAFSRPCTPRQLFRRR